MSPEVVRPPLIDATMPIPPVIGSNSTETRGTKAWVTLLTKETFLPGVLTLHYSLQRTNTLYPLVVLHTTVSDRPSRGLPRSCVESLQARGIPTIQVADLRPKISQDFQDKSFHEAWTKLAVFGLAQFERVVYLDADMLVLRNMDELMAFDGIDPVSMHGKGDRVYAAAHACVCNPAKRAHYPRDWIPANCAYTTQHSLPISVPQTVGPPSSASKFYMPNGGMLVLNPSREIYQLILDALDDPKTATYGFADQELLADLFGERWVGLPYVYNALKTMRWAGVHDPIWDDEKVKNVHYIMSPKPWMMDRPGLVDSGHESGGDMSAEDCSGGEGKDETVLSWWWGINDERERVEQEAGICG